MMVDQDLGDASPGDLQDGTCNHGATGERKHIIDDGAFTERPALDGVRRSESVDDVHELRLSRQRGWEEAADQVCRQNGLPIELIDGKPHLLNVQLVSQLAGVASLTELGPEAWMSSVDGNQREHTRAHS
jgi:hypothetical protein